MRISTLAVFVIFSIEETFRAAAAAEVTDTARFEDDDKIDLSQIGWRLYGKPMDNTHRMHVERWGNPEERGPYFEGDLLNPNSPKNGIKHESYRWKNREIPYEIKGGFSECLFAAHLIEGTINKRTTLQFNFTADMNDVAMINRAIGEYYRSTCIRFVPRRPTDVDFISIENGSTGCWSSIGDE